MRALAAAALLASCASGPPAPAVLEAGREACASCRMTVSEARFAAQIAARGEEPRFFDDVGCLRDFLRAEPARAGSVAYVADHRTREWADASRAVYTRIPGVATPMGSHLVAHKDAASRDADPRALGGSALSAADVFSATLPGSPP